MASLHDAGLDDVKICVPPLLWCFYPTSLLYLHIKNLASLPGFLLCPRNNCVPRGQDLAKVSQFLDFEIVVGVPVTSAVLILPQWAVEEPFKITAHEWKKLQLNKVSHQPFIWFGSACVHLSKSPEINFQCMQKSPSSFQISMSINDYSLELVVTWSVLETVVLKIHKSKHQNPYLRQFYLGWLWSTEVLQYLVLVHLCTLYFLVQESSE